MTTPPGGVPNVAAWVSMRSELRHLGRGGRNGYRR